MSDGQGSKPKTDLVGIGASACGLDGLKQFFSCTPGDSGLAYVVVVHLMPEQPSLLADLLQPFVGMPVQQVSEDLLVEPDNVYVIPPGHNLATIDSHLRISDLGSQRRHRAPIDHFFETLAKTHGEQAVGVVLSGSGADGSVGIPLIKEQSEADRQALQHIFAQVRARTGQDFSRYKQSTVLRRIRRRMQLHHQEQLSDYLDLLRRDAGEAHLLAEELLITVTQFFRDRAQLRARRALLARARRRAVDQSLQAGAGRPAHRTARRVACSPPT